MTALSPMTRDFPHVVVFLNQSHIHFWLRPELALSKEVTCLRFGLGKGWQKWVLVTVNDEFNLAFLTVEFALSPIPSVLMHLMPVSSGDQAVVKKVSVTFSVGSW